MYEFKNRQLFDVQTELNKINKNLYILKNYQDNLFLHRNNEYILDLDEHAKFNIEIYKLYSLIDSISELQVIQKNDYEPILKDIRYEIEKYQSECSEVVKLNEELYAPNVGIIPQLNTISAKLRKEKKYQELDLVKYVDKIEEYRNDLLKGKITKREFNKKATNLFEQIASTQITDYDNYYLMLFEDNVTNYFNNSQLEYSKLKEIGETYNEGILEFIDKQHSLLLFKINSTVDNLVKLRSNYFKNSLINYLIVILLIIILNILLFNYFYQIIYKPWNRLEKDFEKLSEGKIPKIETLSNISEFKIITHSLESFTNNLEDKNHFIKELSKRNYNAEFEVDENDELGNSLSNLRSDLIKADQEASQYQETEQNQKWAATGIAKIGAVMRQNTEDIDSLSKNVLKEIIQYIEAVQGALYLYDEDNDQLVLNASFSYGKQRTKHHIVKPYEGLIGTILVEKREYYYETIPENYIFLETGLGYSIPQSLFAYPLIFENKIYGIIEIASMTKIEDYKRQFLLNLGIEIAITISYTEINVQTKQLLEQSKKQALELQSNEKLFKKNQDNLKSLLRMTEQRLRDKEEGLKLKEEIVQKKVKDLLDIEKELSEKEEYIETMTNEYENIRSELENKNKELRERIADLEKRLRDKN